MKLKFVASILFMVGSVFAAPYSSSIPDTGISGHCSKRGSYSGYYYSAFGGNWVIKGHITETKNGARESFSGTVSDTTINGTFTEANFDWLSDGYRLCAFYTEFELATSFSLNISNGKVTGSANFD